MTYANHLATRPPRPRTRSFSAPPPASLETPRSTIWESSTPSSSWSSSKESLSTLLTPESKIVPPGAPTLDIPPLDCLGNCSNNNNSAHPSPWLIAPSRSSNSHLKCCDCSTGLTLYVPSEKIVYLCEGCKKMFYAEGGLRSVA